MKEHLHELCCLVWNALLLSVFAPIVREFFLAATFTISHDVNTEQEISPDTCPFEGCCQVVGDQSLEQIRYVQNLLYHGS